MSNITVVTLPHSEMPTMSSLEMVDYINADRNLKAEAHSAKFLAEYKDRTGRDLC